MKANADPIEWQPVAHYAPDVVEKSECIVAAYLPSVSRRLSCAGDTCLRDISSLQCPERLLLLLPGKTSFSFRTACCAELGRYTLPPRRTTMSSGANTSTIRTRDEVHIYASTDRGATWEVAYTFPRGAVRHVHNIVYDEWANCLWVLTGDNGSECRILRVSCDFKNVDVVLSGNQQARAVALVPTPDGLYFSSDTPLESNHVYRLDRGGTLTELAPLSSSSIYGCRAGGGIFFSTMVEPSQANLDSQCPALRQPRWFSLA